jgi:DNA processing protein
MEAHSVNHQPVNQNQIHLKPSYGAVYRDDVLYPKKLVDVLGAKAPKVLYYHGNLSLLNEKAVGFCGSRRASEKGLETAQDCAEQIAKQQIVVVSGNAAGVDVQAHRAALEVGGGTIFVLPEGIEHFRIKRELKNVWDVSRVLVLSHYEPNARWQAFRAMERNTIIVGLSDAMIVIEAGEKGGTIEAGRSTLRLKRPLFVAEYENMEMASGNVELLKKGAMHLKKKRETHKASLTSLFEYVAGKNALVTTQSSFFL